MTIRSLLSSPCMALQLAALITAIHTGAEGSPDEQIARRFVPEHVLHEIATSDSSLAELSVAVERVDLDSSGSADYLVAAYAGVEEGALRVLRLSPSPAVVADAPQPLGGADVELKIVDVDRDGRPEIAVTFGQLGPSEAWSALRVYRWADRRLQPLTKKSMKDPLLEDLDGDGTLEIIEGIFRQSDPIQPVHTLSGDRYVPAGGLLALVLGLGKLSPRYGYFEIDGTHATGVLKVRSGDNAGAHRVRAAEVLLNDRVVLNAGDLVANRFAEAKIALRGKNTLEIRVFGPADGQMLVWIPAPDGVRARTPEPEE